MNNSAPRLMDSDSAMSVRQLERYAEQWLLSGEISQHSNRTIENRRMMVRNLLWYLRRVEAEACDTDALRRFFAYLSSKKPEPGGRWGNPQCNRPVKPRTVKDYHSHLRTLFRFIVEEGGVAASPMDRIAAPIDRPDEIQPFTETQVEQLLAIARRGRHAKRDQAILLLLLDSGIRVSELCGLRFSDVDMSARHLMVEGKGGKSRPVYFGRKAAKALWAYLNIDGRDEREPLFLSERGEALTRSGIRQLMERLGKEAGITSVRCSPHTCRHYFAVQWLRNGGSQLSLMRAMGHTNMQMTARYVQFTEGDIERQHRQFSPMDNLKKGRKR